MDFLALVSRLKSEYSIAPALRLTTLQGVSGELERLKNCVVEAYLEIQREHEDWQWLRNSVSFATTEGKAIYTPTECGATGFGLWARDSFRCYPTATGTRGEMFLAYRDYEGWRNLYQYGAYRNVNTRPIEMTVTPAKAIGLGPNPSAQGWTIVGDYFKAPTELSANADVPAMPEKFHLAIVYLAMTKYGGSPDKPRPDVVARGQVEYNKIRRRMNQDQLPEITIGGPLA